MNAHEKPDESSDESLAAVPPTPVDAEQVSLLSNLGMGTLSLALGSVGAIVLLASTMTPCVGATRSSKLEWEERQLQMEQAQRDAQINSQVNVQPDAPSDAQSNADKND